MTTGEMANSITFTLSPKPLGSTHTFVVLGQFPIPWSQVEDNQAVSEGGGVEWRSIEY